MSLKPRTGGQILIDQLVIHGADHLFCVPGESYLAALNAMHDSSIEVTVCRQEGGAAMMAEAYGKLTGRPGDLLRHPRPRGRLAAEPMRGHKNPVKGAFLLHDGRILSFDDGMICVWSSDGRLLSAIPVDGVIVLCNESTVITARDGRLVVYDLDLD